ncbi:MAG: hypothetical protein K6F57_02520 [Candidatus Saccharibacteria bacterium]|nr:hypothetical protein [Candidatus Saccharibacteria bacterium]
MANKTLVNWEAREYIEYKKNTGWYVGLAIVTVALCAIAILMQQWTFLLLIVVAVIALLTYTMRSPRLLHYSLSDKGLSEGNNLYLFNDFRSFGVLNENNHYSIVLMPKKRFGTRVTVYFPETEGEQIVDVFGSKLPMEPVKLDLLDRLVRFLRI